MARNLAKLIDGLVKEKTPEQEFLFLLNETVSRVQEIRKPSQTYKPSSLGGCLRKMAYQLKGTELDDDYKEDASGIGIMESGTDRHERIQKAITQMQKMGYDCEWIDVGEYLRLHPQHGTRVVEKKGMETKLYNEVLNLSFMCDGVFRFKGTYYILEIKTEASFKWQGRTNPEAKHIVQAACYAACIGIRFIMFVYENRDFCTKKTFLHEVTDDEIQELVVGRIELCNEYLAEEKVPPMTDKPSECNYCPYRKQCAKDGPTE